VEFSVYCRSKARYSGARTYLKAGGPSIRPPVIGEPQRLGSRCRMRSKPCLMAAKRAST
jgi:hypothetical protein